MITSSAGSSEKNRPVVAVLGTGIMGAAMARRLLRSGLSVRAWNRTRDKAEALVADGAYCAESPEDAVAGADVVLTMLNDGPRVLDAMRAASAGLAPGTVWAQSATVGEAATAELADFARRHSLVFVDAPVLGTRQPAEAGELLVLAAGPDSARAVLAPVFDAVGRLHHMGRHRRLPRGRQQAQTRTEQLGRRLDPCDRRGAHAGESARCGSAVLP